MNAFLNSLPGPEWFGGVDISGRCESEEVNIKLWKILTQEWTKDVRKWWCEVSSPTNSGLEHLHSTLRATLEATVAPESSSESGEVETVRYAWSATASSVASVRLTSQRVAGRDLEDQPVLPGCPSLVLQSLLQAARRQMDWGRRKFRLGDIRRVNVASLEERLESSPPNLPHHGSERRPHAWHTIEGQRISVCLEFCWRTSE